MVEPLLGNSRVGAFSLAAVALAWAAACGGEQTEVAPDTETGHVDVRSDLDAGTSGDSTTPRSDLGARDSDDRRPRGDTRPWEVGGSGDTAPPELALAEIVPDRGSTEGGTKFVLRGEGLTDDTTVYFAGRRADARLVSGNLVGQTPPVGSPGPVPVKARDPSTGADTLSDGFTYVEPLAVDSVSPSSVPTEGGFQVTVEGTGFTPGTRASFDGRDGLHHEFVDSGTLRIVAPPNQAGPADVRLTNRAATTLSRGAVTYVEPLEIDGVRPGAGPTAGGTTVTLRGSGFRADTTVTFGGTRAPLQSVRQNGTRATVRIPSGSPGLVDVAATSPTGGGDVAPDAFYYRTSTDEFALASVTPDRGAADGGTEVRLVGAGLDRSGLKVQFGGATANLVARGEGWARVRTPSQPVGSVDVRIVDGAGNTSALSNGFTYLRNLSIDSVQPSSGPTSGGTTLTLDGRGFRGVSRVRIGGISASFQILDSSTIRATTPSHSPGTFDVTVERGPLEATRAGAFTFTRSLEVFGFSPARGSVAGGTYVLLRGAGFTGSNLGITFDGTGARSVRRVDSRTLEVYTPARPAGRADVRVQRGSDSVKAPDPFEFFSPVARNGGPWGGSTSGSVNIAVFTESQQPIAGAFAMLSTNSESGQTAWTDRDGLATLSGPNVRGPQTVTVTARGFSSVTLQRIDASNITVFLERVPVRATPPPRDTGVSDTGPPTAGDTGVDAPETNISDAAFDTSRDTSRSDTLRPPRPPTDTGVDTIDGPDNPPPPDKGPPIFTGELTGLDKFAPIGPNERTVARVYTTKTNIRSRNPPTGSGNRLFEDGTYRLRSRTGDLALVAVGGILNTQTREFEPRLLGVKRFQNAVRGQTYLRDISLDIELDRTITYKIAQSPLDTGGPDVHRIQPYLDFGFEGVFGRLQPARGTSALLNAERYPALQGKLSDVTIAALGGSYTERSRGGLFPPQSIALQNGVSSTGTRVQYPKLIGVPKITSPARGRRASNGLVSFELTSPVEPEFYWIRLRSGRTVVWDMFAPGSARSIRLPNFPDFSDEPENRRPIPYPSGRISLQIFAVRIPGSTYDTFDYTDLSLNEWSAYARNFGEIRF